MDTIHHVTISNTPSFSSVTLFIDALRPPAAKRCLMCVSKFNASYPINQIAVANVFPPTEQFEIKCDAVQNSYRYSSAQNMVLRNDVVDTFVTSNLVTLNFPNLPTEEIAVFNVINNMENWLEIDMNRLFNLRLNFVNTWNPVGGYVFNLHLKFKFLAE